MGVQILALALTFIASLTVAFGAQPESFLLFDWLAPCLSLLAISFVFGRRENENWKVGLLVAFSNIVLYCLVHLIITMRFLPRFWLDGLAQLTTSHFVWWIAAILISIIGALAGGKWKSKKAIFLVFAGIFAIGPLLQLLVPLDSLAQTEKDGTTFRVQKFALKNVDFGIYDADFTDSKPFDDANTTWLGQAMPRVWNLITAQENEEPLTVINGGFFGAEPPLIGNHEAPIKTEAGVFYDSSFLEEDWPAQNGTLVWKRESGLTKPQILEDAKFSELKNYDGALGGVRVLIRDGKLADTKPGMGGATLKCARTSVAWNRKTNEFYVLSVRDPDGEASSVRSNKAEKASKRKDIQVGGWDVAQVQNYWRKSGMTDAVLFDGGESGQVAFRDGGHWNWIHSSYHFSRTPFFIGEKPVRIVWPMLPPTVANGGVLNWFYVKKAE